MDDRLGIVHPIPVLLGVATTLGSLPARLGALAPSGIHLASIRGRRRGSSPTHALTAVGRNVGQDRFERVDLALASRSSTPWTL